MSQQLIRYKRGLLLPGLLGLATYLILNPLHAQNQGDTPFYLSLDAPPAPELSPAQALDSFRIAEGFRIELVAAEPLVEDPVAISWDEDGKLYVVEMRGFMPDSFGNGEDQPIGSVVRLSDTDGDGQMDEREVLADNLVLPRAISIIPQGLLIAEPPTLWLCPGALNQAATIDCSNKINLGEYGNQPGSVEHAENALLLALDNWIYNAKSDRKFQLLNGELIIQPTVFRGQWGLSQDDDGYLYYNSNSNLITGDLYADFDPIQAGVSPSPGLSQRLHRGDEVFSVRVNPGVNRAYLDGVLRSDGRLRSPTAASGVGIYRGDQFPDSYYGAAFVPESAGNLVAELRLSKGDLSVTTEHITYPDPDWQNRDFLASTDERFRPVDTKTGPDGALYVVDMYRGIIQDHVFLTDELRSQALERGLDRPLGMGRIWRVVHQSNPIDYNSPQSFSTDQDRLVGYLAHKNAWWRETAQRMLVASSSQTVKPALINIINSDNLNAIVHSLWILEGREELDRSLILAVLARNNERLTLHAIRAGCEVLRSDDLLQPLRSNANLNRGIKQVMLFCLRRHFSDEVFSYVNDNIKTLLEDPYLRVALQTVVQGREVSLIETLIANSAENPANASEQESLASLMQSLVIQSLSSTPRNSEQISRLLDLVLVSNGPDWHRVSLLLGMYEASHRSEFQRVMLTEPHQLFENSTARVNLSRFEAAIADARSAFTWPGDTVQQDQKPLDSINQALAVRGAQLFATQCAVCHATDGAGSSGLAPGLRGSARIVNAPEQLIRIILHGLSGPINVADEEWDNIMPGMSHLAEFDDEGISGLVTYLRRSWGHRRSPISPAAVNEIRREYQARINPWTAEELSSVPINKRYEMLAGRYGGFEFRYNGTALEVYASIFSGTMTEIGEDVFLFEPRNLQFEFDRIVDDKSSGVWVQSDTGKSRLERAEN